LQGNDGERHVTEAGDGPADGAISDVPWALVFDPAVNVRALGEIQARGFRAAADLVDRFVNITDHRPPPAADDAPQPDRAQQSNGTTVPDVERLLDSWKSVIGQLAGSVRGVAGASPMGRASFDFVGAQATGQLVLEAAGPGAVSAEVWLHNGGTADRGTVVLRCGELISHEGSVIGSAHVRFEPDTVPMPARCSRGVLVHVEVGANVAPGRYHSTLLVEGHPDIWLPVILTVGPPAA
jgi:hypothetical protein